MLAALSLFFKYSKRGGMFINSCFAHCQSESQDTWLASDSPRVHNKVYKLAPFLGGYDSFNKLLSFSSRASLLFCICPFMKHQWQVNTLRKWMLSAQSIATPVFSHLIIVSGLRFRRFCHCIIVGGVLYLLIWTYRMCWAGLFQVGWVGNQVLLSRFLDLRSSEKLVAWASCCFWSFARPRVGSLERETASRL